MKKIISLLLSVVMILSITAGNSISNATPISLNTTNNGSITNSNIIDVYKFVLETSGKITISATAYIYRVNYRLYDSNGEEIYNPNTRYNSIYNYYDCTEWNDKTGQSYISKTIDLTRGVYYFIVDEYSGNGNYKFNISFEDSRESFVEPTYCNNTLSQAVSISIGKNYCGQIALNDDKDFYKFTISKEQSLIFKANAYIYRIAYYIYDSNGKEVCNPNTHYNSIYNYYDCTEWNSETKESYISRNVTLKPGTYYIGVIKYNGTGNYNFSLSCSHYWREMTNKMAT
ncbi:MAG: hypothetical protein NC227_10720 [Bacteroides sp.]|nr:hypothetical protein [Bacteroides sp.]MCM1434390.1 hypothetical protein [Clostridiales bacterium]